MTYLLLVAIAAMALFLCLCPLPDWRQDRPSNTWRHASFPAVDSSPAELGSDVASMRVPHRMRRVISVRNAPPGLRKTRRQSRR